MILNTEKQNIDQFLIPHWVFILCLTQATMKNLIIPILISSMFFSCSQNQTNEAEELSTEVTEVIIPQISVARFDIDAGQYIHSEVSVSGIVDHVCKHSGKKLKMVTDGGSVHVESETRFDDELIGSEINLKGIVRELRIDESYCLQMEEDNISKHKEGETNEEDFTHKQELIQSYRDSMVVAQVDHLSFYTLEFVSLDKDSE